MRNDNTKLRNDLRLRSAPANRAG